jgi:tRNA-2-methylthio-N6-dimethylallyladenosine synthase
MTPRHVYIETFGCQMNELDSELVAGQLSALGYRFVDSPERAGVVLYNTCSVREHAEQKVWSRLGELKDRKRREPGLVVGVLGCLAERDGTDLIRRMPVVDILCGPGELDKLPRLLDNAVRTRAGLADAGPERESSLVSPLVSAREVALQGNASRRSATLAAAADNLEMLDLSRSISPVDLAGGEGVARRSAYVRITRGCNKFCTYCVVPFTRGAEIHRPPDHIIDECKKLADAGVVEITLLGQTVNHYRFEHGSAVTVGGIVQPQKGRAHAGGHSRDPFAGANVTTFADLLRRIHDEVPAVARLRFVTSYPRDFGDDILETIRDHPRICRYLHVPAQSGSDAVLARMNRGYSVGEYLEFLDRARAHLHQPQLGRPLSLSGDFIVGFPGETDADFDATVALLRRARYKNAFIFKYSPRPGTTAFDRLADDVPEPVKRARNNQLLAVQGEISEALNREMVGLTLDAFVEGISPQQRKRRERAAPRRAVALTVRGISAEETCSSSCPSSGAAPDDHEDDSPVQMAARTDGDQIVLFDAPAGTSPAAGAEHLSGAEHWIGRMARVRIARASALNLFGELVLSP